MREKKSSFDKANREDNLSLSGETNNGANSDEEKVRMLLGRYNTEIFEPDIEELEEPASSEIDALMEKAKMYRNSAVRTRNFKSFFRFLSFAASFLVVCVIFFIALKPGMGDRSVHSPETSFHHNQFRGTAPIASVNKTEAKERKDQPLAYLVDLQGAITIVRSNKEKKITGSCEVLYKSDIVVLTGPARAKVMYPDAFFDVTGPMRFKIEDPDPVVIRENTSPKVLEPTITTRGILGLNNTQPIVMPPKTLLAAAVAPITRARSDAINVFSPRLASFTDRPIIWIGGDPNLTYTVSILDVEGVVKGNTVSMNGNAQRSWTVFISSPPVEDEIYTLQVKLNGKIVNEDSPFWLLPRKEREQVSKALKFVDTVKSDQERAFFRASTFCMSGCYSEAYLLLTNVKIQKHDLYDQLFQLCKLKLKIQ